MDTTTGEPWRLGHRPALDGIRGLAIVLVVLCHALVPGFTTAGPVGVTVFFALSGFLITALLLQERADTGGVRVGAFYLRRARRLLPGLVATLTLIGGFMFLLGEPVHSVVQDQLAVLLYVGNWTMVAGGDLYLLSHAWSLAVEEQFYLTWPLLLVLLARRGRRAVMLGCTVGVAYSVGARFLLWEGGTGWNRVYFGSDTHLDALLGGAFLAVAVTGRRHLPRIDTRWTWVGLASVIGLSLIRPGFAAVVVVPGVVVAGTVLLLWNGAQDGGSARWLSWSPLVLLGRRSYGLYLWHFPVFVVVNGVTDGWVLGLLIGSAVSWGLTVVSWRYVEEPFLRTRTATSVQHPHPSPVS